MFGPPDEREIEAEESERDKAEIARLEREVNRLRGELRIIAEATPEEWDSEVRGQFRAWAQNRARHGIYPPDTGRATAEGE